MNKLDLLGVRLPEHMSDDAVCAVLDEHSHDDIEIGHVIADAVVVAFLRAKGFDRIADAYEKVEKWYA